MPILASAGVSLPDVRTGNVDGKVGLLYWPASPTPIGSEAQPLPSAENCEVHMVPGDDRDRELRYPCGKWFAPPVGRYDYWLEMPGRITPRQSLATYAASPFRGAGLGAVIPVAPAGAVALPRDRTLAPDENLRLIATRVEHAMERNAAVFDRRVSAADARKPVQMPEGAAVAGRFDRQMGDAIALSRPVNISAAQTVTVWPEPPSESDLLVVLNKPPEMQGTEEPHRVSMTLDDTQRVRDADVLVNARNVIVAIWYAVDARRATIALQSNALFWAAQEVRLTRGKVTTVRSSVKPLPQANVSINAPPEASLPDAMSLEITRGHELVRRLSTGAGVHAIDRLPAEVLTFTLSIGGWKQARIVDLSSGEDARVAFDLAPLAIAGTVYYGDDPSPARIAFHNGENVPVVETNDRGEYETTLWWPDVYTAKVSLVGKDQPPFLDAFREIFFSGRVDFRVPRTDYRVRVVDAATGRPIAGARVIAGNVAAEGGRQSAQRTTTGEDGVAVLPPLLAGEVIVDVSHDRYESVEPLRLQVDGERHELDVALRPLSIADELRLVLPGGVPASQADVWALDDAMNAIWRGTSGGDGTLAVPDMANGALLLVRHPNAATALRRWSVSAGATTWTLDLPAEPLTISAEPGLHVVLWIDGVRLSGAPLTVATWSVPTTNRGGLWTARNLPPRPVRLVTVAGDAATSGVYDAVAREIPYPWPRELRPDD